MVTRQCAIGLMQGVRRRSGLSLHSMQANFRRALRRYGHVQAKSAAANINAIVASHPPRSYMWLLDEDYEEHRGQESLEVKAFGV
eukprot:6468432-Amphidinium_carterae.1